MKSPESSWPTPEPPRKEPPDHPPPQKDPSPDDPPRREPEDEQAPMKLIRVNPTTDMHSSFSIPHFTFFK
jgi:hypothetical protein